MPKIRYDDIVEVVTLLTIFSGFGFMAGLTLGFLWKILHIWEVI